MPAVEVVAGVHLLAGLLLGGNARVEVPVVHPLDVLQGGTVDGDTVVAASRRTGSSSTVKCVYASSRTTCCGTGSGAGTPRSGS